jgi:hypothetical protein
MRSACLVIGIAVTAATSHAAGVTIIEDGKAAAVIYAPAKVMSEENVKAETPPEQKAEKARKRLRESVKDFAAILERISGAKLEIVTGAPPRKSKSVPIVIGKHALKRFGKPKKRSPFKQGWRIVVSRKGVGLIGESDEATSYAIYELLDRLGCRWYMPGEMGEVLPSMKTVTLEKMNVSDFPATVLRDTWYRPVNFARRNRLGGIEPIGSGHGLESYYLCHEDNIHLLKENPDWNSEVDGERKICGRICWASDGAAKATGDIIIKQLEKKYETHKGLAPADTVWFCECAKCKALDTGDFDSAYGQMSITDRYINFINKIAKQVHTKYPEMLFGSLAYEQYTRPPLREKPDPSIYWSFAPILYCRAHSFMDPNCWSRAPLRDIVQGWGKITDKLMFRDYGFHLAEVSAPFPLITKWSKELSFVYQSGWTMWRPETMPSYEASMPGLYLGIRMAWKKNADPNEIIEELFMRFYGSAAGPMRDYWMTFDKAWTECDEHAGGMFGYLDRFPPEVLQSARKAMNAALKTSTNMEKRRVELVNESLKEFELFMKMYRDLFEGRLANLHVDKDRWMETWKALGKKYNKEYAFAFFMNRYMPTFMGHTYEDASRIARKFNILTPKPLLQWHYRVDKDAVGKKEGWFKKGLDDNAWKTRDISVDTWADLGLWTYYGTVWNRATVKIPKVQAGKKIYLWISRTDGGAIVYVNGKLITYINPDKKFSPYLEEGKAVEEFINHSKPASFDITSAIKAGEDNQITIAGRRTRLYELGTGGLTGPVYLYSEK